VIALVVALILLWYTRDVMLLVFAGVLLAACLRTLARLLTALIGKPTGLALVFVVLIPVGSTMTIFWARGADIGQELEALRAGVPEAAAAAQARLQCSEIGRRVVAPLPTIEQALPDARSAISRTTGVVSRRLSVLTTSVVVSFLGIAFAATPRPYVAGVLALVPARKVRRAREVLHRMEATLWWWMVGRVVSCRQWRVTSSPLWWIGRRSPCPRHSPSSRS
jgi:predicted PurR-regulated permease PerM